MHIVLLHHVGARAAVMTQTLTMPAYVCLQLHGTNTIHISNNSYDEAPEMTNLIVINTLFARVQIDQRISYHIF